MEVVQEKITFKAPELKCFRCNTTEDKNLTYGLLKNTFYCSACWMHIPNMNNAIDDKFINLEKRTDDLINGAVEKNKQIRNLNNRIDELETILSDIKTFLESTLTKQYNDLEKDIEEKEIAPLNVSAC